MSEFGKLGDTLRNIEDPLAFLEGFFSYAPVGFQVFAPDGRLLVANEMANRTFGVPPPTGYNILKDEQSRRIGIMSEIERAFRGEVVKLPTLWYDSRETPGRGPDGRLSAISATLFPIFGKEKEIRFIAVIIRDQTAELEAHEREVRSRLSLEGLQNLGKTGVWTAEVGGAEPKEWSRQMFEIFGLEPADRPPTFEVFMSRVYPEDRASLLEAIGRMRSGVEAVSTEFRVFGERDEIRWVRLHRDVVRGEGPAPAKILGFVQDIHEARERESRLRMTEERFRLLFDSDLMGIYISSREGPILEANARFLSMTGYTREDLRNGLVNWKTLTPPGYEVVDQRAIEETRARGSFTPIQKEYVRKDGSRIPILVGGTAVGYSSLELICFVLDLTEMRRLEQQVRRAQKMEAIGRFAGGVAHDFNNLLSVILLQADEALAELKGAVPTAKVHAIRESAERAARLTRRILAFSRERVFEGAVVDLNGMVRDFTTMLRGVLSKDIELSVQCAPGPVRVRVDPAQIEQTLLNLTFNSRDAMPKGGRLSIGVSEVDLGDLELKERRLRLTPGRYAMLTVADTGEGMDYETLSHAFEPFFTTKEPGKGTGLGLSTVYGIVNQSGGDILIESAVGRGTTVSLYFPRVAAGERAVTQAPAPQGGPGETAGKTILLVEDEDALRSVTAAILSKAGYRVIEASSGGKALDPDLGPVDLILTDVIMPGLTGPALVKEYRARRPGSAVKALYMSGYSAGELKRYGIGEDEGVFVEKPFTARVLLKRVVEALAGARVADPGGHEPESQHE